jgi:hypothetical protein
MSMKLSSSPTEGSLRGNHLIEKFARNDGGQWEEMVYEEFPLWFKLQITN